MPFSTTTEARTERYWTEFFTEFLKPEIEGLGYHCERSQAVPANIINNIIHELTEADIVVAVLTDFNANVWYELGIRHALKNGTIMVIDDGQELPFDISHYGVIKYHHEDGGKPIFNTELKAFLNKLVNNTQRDNPVQDFIYKQNINVNRTILTRANDLLEGITWANIPLAELIAFSEPRFHFYILNKSSRKALDVPSKLLDINESKIHVWAFHHGANQLWEIRRRSGTLCSIMTVDTKKCLEVKAALPNDEVDIQINDYKGSRNQLWEIFPNGDETYRMIVQSTKKCIEADAQKVHEDGGRVIQYNYNTDLTQNAHQHWILEPIPIKFH